MKNLDARLAKAVEHFWRTRARQAKRQGAATGKRDQGSRSAVTGGAQLDGFRGLVKEILSESGLPDASVHTKKLVLPGYFRPTKEWDLVVVCDGKLIAAMEFKSHVGPSFGNNFNNRVEEALGNATDLWAAYRDGVLQPSSQPWLGYLMMLEDHQKSISPVRVAEPHFSILNDFRGASYMKRYELLCLRLVREKLYDAACLITSSREKGKKGQYTEPSGELSFRAFVASLMGRAIAVAKSR